MLVLLVATDVNANRAMYSTIIGVIIKQQSFKVINRKYSA